MVKRKADTSSMEEKNAKENDRECGSSHQFHQQPEVDELRKCLLHWYDVNKRDLPWRKLAKDMDVDINQRAYGVWVSEIMAQQTQVSRVVGYYNKWMKKWPTVQALAKATLEEVREVWSGLGYYSRGTRLHEGAVKVVNELDGEIPGTADKLLELLPGVGRYTAGAIASVALGQVTGLVDGNVIRVFTRMRAIGADTTNPGTTDAIWSIANHVVDPDRPGDFNQSLMELGATVCSPRTPNCVSCPVRQLCRAHAQVEKEKQTSAARLLQTSKAEQRLPDIECCVEDCKLCLPPDELWDPSLGVQNYPRKGKKKSAREERLAVCVVYRDKAGEVEYLIVQRPSTGLLANLWQFPIAPVDLEASEEDCKTSMHQQLVDTFHVEHSQLCDTETHGQVTHIFSHVHHTYSVLSCRLACDTTVNTDQCGTAARWVTRQQFMESAVSSGMKKVFKNFEQASKGQKTKQSTVTRGNKSKQKKIQDKKQPAIVSFFKPN